MLQVYDGSRTCSLMDVACNFLGTMGGSAAALLFQPELAWLTGRKSRRGGGGALLLACAWGAISFTRLCPSSAWDAFTKR